MAIKRKQHSGPCRAEALFRVAALRRSGHHGVITWLCGSGTCYTVNNVRLDKLRFGAPSRSTCDRAILNFEDYRLCAVAKETSALKYTSAEGRAVVCSKPPTWLCVLRDPYNMFASRIAKRSMHTPANHRVVAKWIEHAEAYLGDTSPLGGGCVFVNYNRWFLNRDYRRELSSRLGIAFDDRRINLVSNIGGGSSFDGVKYDGRAQQMQVLSRWKSWREHPFMKGLLANRAVRELAARIWSADEGLP